MIRRSTRLTALVIAALTLSACASAPAAPAPSEPASTGDGHGDIAGAVELDEPALGLTAIGTDGVVQHLDLLEETVVDLGEVGEPSALHTDGRYLFAQTAAGIEVVDSGVWTWDHVDHFHYYRAEPRLLGAVDGEGPATVATSNSSTTGGTGIFFAGSGEAVLLDTEALSKGEIVERFRLDATPHGGMVVPVGSYALVSDGDGSVVAHDAGGEPTGAVEACADARGTITTRVGAVIGCADGALLASVTGGGLTIERIPYPAGTTAPPATAFANREGRPTVAALAGSAGIWLLDTRDRSWTLLPAPADLAAVTAVDDEAGTMLALAADGRVLVLDGSGAISAATEPLVAASLAGGHAPTLIADQQRAYIAGPAEKTLWEIDFADSARISRTFDAIAEPAFVAETGR